LIYTILPSVTNKDGRFSSRPDITAIHCNKKTFRLYIKKLTEYRYRLKIQQNINELKF